MSIFLLSKLPVKLKVSYVQKISFQRRYHEQIYINSAVCTYVKLNIYTYIYICRQSRKQPWTWSVYVKHINTHTHTHIFYIQMGAHIHDTSSVTSLSFFSHKLKLQKFPKKKKFSINILAHIHEHNIFYNFYNKNTFVSFIHV